MQIAIALFPAFTALDAVGPYQVFTYLPDAEVVLCAAGTGIVSDDHGMLDLDVRRTLTDVPSPDVIVIPGGRITHRMIRDGDPVIDWIRTASPHTDWTTSVCTAHREMPATSSVRRSRHDQTIPVRGSSPAQERPTDVAGPGARLADIGYSTLLMPDFPQLQPAPAPTLALAASVADNCGWAPGSMRCRCARFGAPRGSRTRCRCSPRAASRWASARAGQGSRTSPRTRHARGPTERAAGTGA